MNYFLAGCALWGIVVLVVFQLRPHAVLSNSTVVSGGRTNRIVIVIVTIGVILMCILPMSLSPHWNGEPTYSSPYRVDQYEVLAESILDGRINLDYGDMDPRLLEMDNPYDPEAREEAGILFHWDHAFYNGKYYMYFGVVPVFLVFLPFRLLFGTSLTTYHATQIFTAFFIAGIFRLFYILSVRYMRRMTMSVYLALTAGMAIMCSWYFAWTPALYCTAISAGVCTQIWSLICYIESIYSHENKSVRWAVWGSVFGALTFGCRPTIALINFLVTPLFLFYSARIQHYRWRQILYVVIPFVVAGVLLMIYNYVRFESPFEFGQTYQITQADQSKYGDFGAQFDWFKIINGIEGNFVWYSPLNDTFPYLREQSLFRNFPICVAAAACLIQKDTLRALQTEKLILPVCALIVGVVLITAAQVLQAPFLIERYRCDIYWIVAIVVFLSFGTFLQTLTEKNARIWGFVFSIFALITIFRCFLLWSAADDFSFTNIYPEYLEKFSKVLSFGF